MGPPADMRSTSAGSDLNPESAPWYPGVWREAQASIGNAYDDGDLQGTNSHAHPENTQLSEPSMSNLASGHGDQTPSAASNTGRIYAGYVVRKSPTSSAESSTKKADVKKQDSGSQRIFPKLDKSPLYKGKRKASTPKEASSQKKAQSTPKQAPSQKKELQGQTKVNYGTGQSSRTTLPETSGGYELAEAQDSISAAAASTLPNSEIDNNSSKGKSKETPPPMPAPESEIQENSQKGKSKEATPPISSGEDSDIHRESEKGKDKATETTHPMSHTGVDVRENSQEDRPSGATVTTSNLETIAESDGDSIRTGKPSDVPGNEAENEDEANGGSVGSGGEGVDDGDPSSSTRPTKKRRRKKKKSSQPPTQKIEEAANEERSAKQEKAKEEEMSKRMNDFYQEISRLKNDLKTDDRLDPAEKLILIVTYHNYICGAFDHLSQSKLEELRNKLQPGQIQNRRYHFTEAVHTVHWLASIEKGRPLLESLVETIYSYFHEASKGTIAKLCSSIGTGLTESDRDYVENAKENSDPLYWYWICRIAAPRVVWCYNRRDEQRPGLSPSDCDDPWKLLTLHAYWPESPLCARYPLFEATGAAVSEALKAFVDSKDKRDAKDLKDLFHVWGDPDVTQVDRLYIQKYLPIGRSSALSSSSPRSPPPNIHNDMATHALVSLPLPVLPADWSSEKDFKAIASLSAATQRSIEPVGPHFLAHARRARHKRTFSEDDRIQAQENVKKVEDDDSGEITEPEDPMMLSRDAKDWKSQDHYAVLGLSKYRYKATEEQIKRAHRKKVLRHHPDKKAAAGSAEDDSFFKCIQKAHEILVDPVKRRQFDSVDEHADVEPPTKKQLKDGKFYKLWSNVFKAEGRFSNIQPVPKFGDENTSEEEVINFYNFFYNFDSWRSFEYQDEDVPDDNENRDQKRHVEKKNNNARKKKKLEDTARLRKLVETAEASDLRIKKFKAEASALKNKKRLDKEAADRKAAEDAKAAKEAEAKAAKEAEEKAKVEKEQSKKAKEAAKAAVKKNRRVLKGSIKDANYFVSGDASAAAITSVSDDVDLVTGKIDPDETAALAAKLSGLKVANEIKGVWIDEVKRLLEAGKIKASEVKTLA